MSHCVLNNQWIICLSHSEQLCIIATQRKAKSNALKYPTAATACQNQIAKWKSDSWRNGRALEYSPVKMVLNHGDHGVLDVLLLLGQLSRHLLLKLLAEGLDDGVAVSDLLPVYLDERKETLLGAELALVVHILRKQGLGQR